LSRIFCLNSPDPNPNCLLESSFDDVVFGF
jgi:hypothetical protein